MKRHVIITNTKVIKGYYVMNRKRLLSLLMAGVIGALTVLPVGATTTQDKIKDARNAKNQTESSLQETQSRIDLLESKKGESEAYLEELNRQLNDLKESLEELQRQSEEKQAELLEVQAQLAEAKEQEAKQYEDMKLRIQYMYEQSSSGYLELLFSAGNFADFLNRAGNISQITQYDRDMLADYQKTKETIAKHENTIQEEKKAIEVLKQESAKKQTEVEEVVQATYNQICEYAEDLEDAESLEASLLNQINQQETAINALLKQAKDEEAAAKRAAEKAAREAAEEAARQAAAEAAKENSDGESSDQEDSSQETAQETVREETSKEDVQEEQQEEESREETKETGNTSSQGRYLGNFRLTAYCNCSKCCGQWSGGSTASGTTPTPGRTVAMGGIPFGTKLLINGNVYVVEDRGTAYGHVDIFMGSHQQALNFGSRYADVYVIE